MRGRRERGGEERRGRREKRERGEREGRGTTENKEGVVDGINSLSIYQFKGRVYQRKMSPTRYQTVCI